MAAEKITATFWDCGGVFLTNGWDHQERRSVTEHFGLSFEEFEERHEEPNDAWERGAITLREYLQETVFYKPRSFSPEEFFAQMRAVSKPLHPEMIDWVRKLRAQRMESGLREIYLLSNESRELMAYRIPAFRLTGLFDAYLVSAYIGLRKPEAAFFDRVLEICQRPPEECVFVDDRQENVDAAERAKIHGIRMTSPQHVIAELGKLGVVIQQKSA
ncbi:MAG TPA: HAD family phosphatase [Acidobacteriaceae bacterium]|nr:HAD family phosphatase [Acidobacteriaceae bacterium]